MKQKAILMLLSILFTVPITYAAVTDCNKLLRSDLTKIEDIFDNPGKYVNEQVTISGIVTQYFEGNTETTSYYLVQGNYGGVMKINTSIKSPEVFGKYIISGVVVIDLADNRPVLIEQCRGEKPKWAIMVLAGSIIALFAIVVIFLLQRKKTSEPGSKSTSQTPSGSTGSARADDGYSTVKINLGDNSKLITLPAELEIVSEPDKGKKIRLSGYPSADGAIVTIGREVVSGDKRFAHIQLMDKTVSRKQAEIVYKDSAFILKNLSETNHTQIDGKALMPNQMMELRNGMVIRTGEVEFYFTRIV